VENIGKRPSHSNGEKWKTEEHVMNEGDNQHICDPHALAVEICRVGVRVAVCDSHIHGYSLCVVAICPTTIKHTVKCS